MLTNFTYNANGSLIGAVLISGKQWLILSDLGSEFVVSKYLDGQREWMQGYYFADHHSAMIKFAAMLLENVN